MLLGNLGNICSEHIPYFKKSDQIKIPYFRKADQTGQTQSMTKLTKILYKPFYTSLLFPSTHKGHLAHIFKLYLYDPSKKRGLALQQIWSVERKRISMLLIFLFHVSGQGSSDISKNLLKCPKTLRRKKKRSWKKWVIINISTFIKAILSTSNKFKLLSEKDVSGSLRSMFVHISLARNCHCPQLLSKEIP